MSRQTERGAAPACRLRTSGFFILQQPQDGVRPWFAVANTAIARPVSSDVAKYRENAGL